MSKPLLKIICIITIFSITVAVIIGSVSMIRSTEYLTAEIEEKLCSTAEKYSHDFSSKFNHMEGLTDSLFAHVSTSFDKSAFQQNPVSYLGQYKKDLEQMIRKTLSTTSTAHSLYVTFNPELTPENDEVWYAVINGTITKISVDFNRNERRFGIPYEEDMAYFYRPQETKTGTWCGPYYDQDIDQMVFSYSRAIYADGLFIGVAGADITARDMIKVINEMKLYPGGYSALLDEDFEFIVYPQKKLSKEHRQITAYLKQQLPQAKASPSQADRAQISPAPITSSQTDKNRRFSGILTYSLDEGKAGTKDNSTDADRLLAYSYLDNGWLLINTQSQAEAFAPIHSLGTVFKILALLLAIVLIAFLIVFSISFIKKQTFLEEENREKDVMLIYQSRQAKTGEMMGNITHQWKQPLNTINLILANLLDSYRFGDLDEDKLQKSVSKVESIVERMSETITDFSDFLKPSKAKLPFDSRNCIKSALSLIEESINKEQISVKTFYEGDTFSFGYPNELTHVIFNLLTNARDAIVSAAPPGRNITIQTRRKEALLEILIINEGDPIAPHTLEHLFEPYFTTKSDTDGTGLGLYISREIVEQRMDGRLFVENVSGGVQCRIQLPVSAEH